MEMEMEAWRKKISSVLDTEFEMASWRLGGERKVWCREIWLDFINYGLMSSPMGINNQEVKPKELQQTSEKFLSEHIKWVIS